MRAMKAVACKSHGFGEAAEHDRVQQLQMTPDERRDVAKALRDRYYGTDTVDVRKAHGRP